MTRDPETPTHDTEAFLRATAEVFRPESVPATYRLAESIFEAVTKWGVDKLRWHPTDIYQIIEAHPAIEQLKAQIATLTRERDEARAALDGAMEGKNIL